MKIEPLPIAGALLITPRAFADDRGYFKEVFAASRYEKLIENVPFVQDNVSFSYRNVLRGLHGAPGMAKLVQTLAGSIFDVLVDIRPGSPTYRAWHGIELHSAEHAQVLIPAGCLHGFLCTSDSAIVLYKQTAYYDPRAEIGVAWDDPAIGIEWPLHGTAPLLSEKDARNPRLDELPVTPQPERSRTP